jgi:hypothetical protein
MKYKRGDRVKIKSLDWYNENKDQHGKVACGYHVFTEDMSKFCGCTMIVCNRTNLGVMTMGGSASYWTDEMIEGLADAEPQDKMISLNKACKVLKNTIVDDVSANRGSVIKYMSANEFIEYFRKVMEE